VDTNIIEYKKTEIISRKSIMPPVLTIGLLIVMTCFISIVRGVIHNSYEEVSIPALSSNYVISDNLEINTSEQAVLTMLSSVLSLSEQTEQMNYSNSLYYKTLQQFLSSEGVDLTTIQARNLKEKMIAMQEIINYEGQTNFTKMSLDGRSVFTYISQEIYEICGLDLVLDSEGMIEKITDQSGNILYIKAVTVSVEDFQIEALAITVSCIILLFSICYIISKKNQLFNKEVKYDGFDEERFA
jgi:hypothetical protein